MHFSFFFWIIKVCNFRSFSTFVPFRFDFFDTPLLFKVTNYHTKVCCLHKQPPEVFCKKRCSEKFYKFHMKALVLESPFNKVTGLQSCNFIKKRLQQRYYTKLWILQNFKNSLFIEHLWWLLLCLFYRKEECRMENTDRSSHAEVFFKKGNFAKFTGKHQCWSLFLIKL